MLRSIFSQIQPMIRLPKVLVVPATVDDVPEIVSLHYRAFAPDNLYINLFGKSDTTQLTANMERRLRNVVDKGGDTVLLKAVRGGRLVGYAQWGLPKESILSSEGPPKETEVPHTFADGTNVELARDFFGQLDAREKAIKEPHFGPLFLENCSRPSNSDSDQRCSRQPSTCSPRILTFDGAVVEGP